MKFQDSSFNGLKVTVGTKSVTHTCTHAPKAICPINFFKVGGIMKENGELDTSVHEKATHCHQYIEFSSCHPLSCKQGIP